MPPQPAFIIPVYFFFVNTVLFLSATIIIIYKNIPVSFRQFRELLLADHFQFSRQLMIFRALFEETLRVYKGGSTSKHPC
jgi:hypothetical protein